MVKELEAIRAEASEDRAFASDALSTRAKAITFGVLAIVWLLLGGTQQALTSRFQCFVQPLLWIAVICVIALLLDFLQYVFVLIEADIALKASLKASQAKQAGYDEGSVLRILSTGCFIGKLLATAASAFWLLTIMLTGLAQ